MFNLIATTATSYGRFLIEIFQLKINSGDYLVERSVNLYAVQLEELVEKQKRRAIIGHAKWLLLPADDQKYTFPAARHLWNPKSNKETLLYGFLEKSICSSNEQTLEVAISCMTPDVMGK